MAPNLITYNVSRAGVLKFAGILSLQVAVIHAATLDNYRAQFAHVSPSSVGLSFESMYPADPAVVDALAEGLLSVNESDPDKDSAAERAVKSGALHMAYFDISVDRIETPATQDNNPANNDVWFPTPVDNGIHATYTYSAGPNKRLQFTLITEWDKVVPSADIIYFGPLPEIPKQPDPGPV